jgi:hypothetical protein
MVGDRAGSQGLRRCPALLAPAAPLSLRGASREPRCVATAQAPRPALRAVHRVRQPLAGLPAWTPALHACVALVAPAADRALLVDLLPARATAVATVGAMLRGRAVEGVARARRVRWPVGRAGYVVRPCVGASARSDEEVRRFVEAHGRRDVSLLGNNCYTFEAAVLAFLLGAGDAV